ncbi:MAG: arsenite methyltransferase [Flavisolibacter sp.]
MNEQEKLKELVRQKYEGIALQDKKTNESSCCGSGACSTQVYNIMSENYTQMDGYDPAADLGLGCGLPTQYAQIKKGDVVIDLGSGAGNDAFIARYETGSTGKVIGIDFTPAMVEKARKNAELRGLNNVEFLEGDIEKMPLPADSAEVVISNCVLNLVPNKDQVFKEIFRVLKPGGHFSISDIVLEGELPKEIKEAAEMYAGCVSGAIQKQAYIELIEKNLFENVRVQKDKAIIIPDDILKAYLSPIQLQQFKDGAAAIKSITVFGQKPLQAIPSCCGPSCCK